MRLSILGVLLTVATSTADLTDEDFLRKVDPLAPHDEWGLLHQSREVNAVDFAQRYPSRWFYYFKASEQVVMQPAYVGAMQRELRRLGYYCGPIDGIFTPEVGDAIALLQKNYSMRVTGTFTDPVRRALRLP
jgi:hypothetical protein